jgi:hypothetical protein
VTYDDNTRTLTWAIRFNNLIGGSIVNWHFHRGNANTASSFLAVGGGSNANILYEGFPNVVAQAVTAGRTFDTDSTTSGWYNHSAVLTAPQYAYDFSQAKFYFNIHTTTYTAGEIRGQVIPVGKVLSDFGQSLPTLEPASSSSSSSSTGVTDASSSSSSSSTGTITATTAGSSSSSSSTGTTTTSNIVIVQSVGVTAYNFTVSNGSLTITTGNNPTINFPLGQSVVLDLSALSALHPFYILKQSTLPTTVTALTDPAEAVLSGAVGTNHYGTGAKLTFTPTATGTFVYVCSVHLFGGTINVVSATASSSSSSSTGASTTATSTTTTGTTATGTTTTATTSSSSSSTGGSGGGSAAFATASFSKLIILFSMLVAMTMARFA